MGFLKKKASIKLPGEINRTSSKSGGGSGGGSGSGGGAASPASERSDRRTAIDDERRQEDDSASGLWTDVESRVTGTGASKAASGAPSRSSVAFSRASASSGIKEAREKLEAAAATAASPSKSKKSSFSSGDNGNKWQEKKTEKKAESKQRSSSNGKKEREVNRPKSPLHLGIKKVAGSDKKASARGQSRSVSAGRGRRSRSETPSKKRVDAKGRAKRKDGKKSTSDVERKKARDRIKSNEKGGKRPPKTGTSIPTPSKGKKSAMSEVTTKVTNGKVSKTSKTKASTKSKSPIPSSRSRPTSDPSSSRRQVAPKKRMHLSDDESSCSSRSSVGSSYSVSSYYSETETEMEDSTMYTDASDFVSMGYNTTDDDDNNTHNLSQSTSIGSEVSGDGLDGASTSYEESETTRSTMQSARQETRNLGKAAKESLPTLGGLAESTGRKQREDGVGPDVIGEDAASPVNNNAEAEAEDEKSEGSVPRPDPDLQPSRAESRASGSMYDDFMKKMEGFMVKNPEHHLTVVVTEHGNIEKLELQELAYVPKPSQPNAIVIKVDCSTITLQDCMIRRGKWYEMQKLPFVPGSDFVGTIFSMGDEASTRSTFQVGDKVAAAVPSGGNAKYITMPYQNIIRVPTEADSVTALCLSSTYVPAREALDLARKLNTPFTGANILVIGGNGPSGLATIELALLEGANVFTTADERHHSYLSDLGARCFPIDPNKWLPTLQGKMDVVIDSVCLDGYESSSLALNSAGTLVCTGMSAVYTQGQIRAFGMRDVRDYKAMYCRMRAKYIISNAVYFDRMERYDLAPNEYAQHFRYLCHLASKDSIKPLVSSCSPLNLVAATQKAIEHGDTPYGVCVCTPWATKVNSSADQSA